MSNCHKKSAAQTCRDSVAAACHVQRSRSTTTATRLHCSSDATRCKHRASYKVAIWERSASPAANVRSSGQLTTILPAAGERARESERRGWQCQQVGGSTGEIRPTAWLSGWQGGCTVGSGITLHRCADSGTEQHLCPPPNSTAGLTDACKAPEDTHSFLLSLKSDQNNHR